MSMQLISPQFSNQFLLVSAIEQEMSPQFRSINIVPPPIQQYWRFLNYIIFQNSEFSKEFNCPQLLKVLTKIISLFFILRIFEMVAQSRFCI
jgi:hypothetical protein